MSIRKKVSNCYYSRCQFEMRKDLVLWETFSSNCSRHQFHQKPHSLDLKCVISFFSLLFKEPNWDSVIWCFQFDFTSRQKMRYWVCLSSRPGGMSSSVRKHTKRVRLVLRAQFIRGWKARQSMEMTFWTLWSMRGHQRWVNPGKCQALG